MIENLENEEWKTIDGYEDLYQVSNLGRVKSLGNDKTRKEKILKSATSKKGYQVVHLSKDGKQKLLRVHRLVANAFIDNPNNYEQVNHKDENKCNNHVDNLEWCTAKYNNNYGTRNERCSGENNSLSKQVIQLTLDDKVIKTWGGTREIQRELGFNHGNISKCCRGQYKSAHGYRWQFA